MFLWVLVSKFMNVFQPVKNNKTININNFPQKEKTIKEVVVDLNVI